MAGKLVRNRLGAAFAILALLVAIGLAHNAAAQPAGSYFKGKTIKLMVGTSSGGGYDLMARMFAPYFEKRLGAKVLVENRPGGSHMVAMNAVFSATPDGLSLILASAEGAVLGRLMDEPGIRFDLSAFPVIARVNSAARVLIINPGLPFKTIQELKASGRTLTMGFAGTTDGGSDTGMIMCHALDLACKSIIGYPSSKEFSMAAVKGEVDGTVVAEDSAVRFSESGQLLPVVVIGRDKSAMLPKLPTVFDVAPIAAEKAWWVDLRDDIRKLGRLLVTTPGVPADRLDELRTAAREVLTDRATMKEFDARGMPVQFAAPDEMSAIIRRMLGGGVTPERVREMKHIITEKYYGK